MVFDSLSEYLHVLENKGELHRIKTEVDTNLEIAEIMRRLMYSGKSPAVLFENVKGYDIPVFGNAFGTLDLVRMALNLTDFTEIGKRITDMTKMKIPSGILNKLKVLPKISEIADYAPKYVDSGPVTEVLETEKANLNSLPILKSFPEDAGKFITFGLTITKHPETGIRNIGVYRIQIVNEKKAIMHWQKHKRGAQHSEMMKEHNKNIETAIVIGTDPSTIFSGVAPVPEGMDKFFFSGIVRKKGVNSTWSAALFTSAIGFLAFSTLAAVYRRGPARTFWLGCAVCGWLYLFLIFGPISGTRHLNDKGQLNTNSELATMHAARWVYQRVLPKLKPSPQVATSSEELMITLDSVVVETYGGMGMYGGDELTIDIPAMSGGSGISWQKTYSPPVVAAAYPNESDFLSVSNALWTWLLALVGGLTAKRLARA
jgi:hypothetical protein